MAQSLLIQLEDLLCDAACRVEYYERATAPQRSTLARAIGFLGERVAMKELRAMKRAMPFRLTREFACELIKVYQ